MIEKFGCIEIPVSDMKRAVDFYENTMKLKKTYEHQVWTCFDVGGVSFALAASGTRKGVKGAKVCTSCSMCVFRYATAKAKQDKEAQPTSAAIYLGVSNLDEFHKRLTSQGVKFLTEPTDQGWGGRTAVMLDPDENIIVLSQA